MNRPIRYVGAATSTFQSEPLSEDENGQDRFLSDWNYWVSRQGVASTMVPHFSRHFLEYVSFLKALGGNVFRLSLEPEIVPRPGAFDERVMEEYVRKFITLRLHGIEPFVTINHYTLPMYLTGFDRHTGDIARSGWEHPTALQYFHTLVQGVAAFLTDADKVRAVMREMEIERIMQDRLIGEGLAQYFMTINEPMAVAGHGNVLGIFPPHRKGRLDIARRVLRTLVAAHDIAYDVLKEATHHANKEALVGVGHNWQFHDGVGSSFFRGVEHYVADTFERDGSFSDFIGLQYYCRTDDFSRGHRAGGMGRYLDWGDVYPAGIHAVLTDMSTRYVGKPVWVTEFGFSDKHDFVRPHLILETMSHIRVAHRDGVPVEGILLWTLAHNFEWVKGMSEYFGLVAEAELPMPLVKKPGEIRSWEAWRAVTSAVLNPSPGTRAVLENASRLAAHQYRRMGGT
ncbi:MAG: hypothetical protein B7X04_04380 [Parcubacteria group bacterium 21-54-25]|nr:MAG: hypothetical protein B7X04_04380 [Parcubacteria group bacterium 21-54-25]HQU08303.1 family 1 glycosylhydrolase [Candidatus Paceibacterota bacterium]